MKHNHLTRICIAAFFALVFHGSALCLQAGESRSENVDAVLEKALKKLGFTGRIDSSIEQRLGRPIDQRKADLGRQLFFDRFIGLHGDNSCAACHSPLAGFGDTQSIAIGIESNDIVGPNRRGPRNQRRTPSVINNAFFPKLMWNGRFAAISGNPFDNSKGFDFPNPEGFAKLFPPKDPNVRHLLVAQAHIPPTELPEMAGFTKIAGTSFASSRFQTGSAGFGAFVLRNDLASNAAQAVFDPSAVTRTKVFSQRSEDLSNGRRSSDEPAEPVVDFTQFDHAAHGFTGVPLPPPMFYETSEESRNEPIRDVVLGRLNAHQNYRNAFRSSFPDLKPDQPITYAQVGQALAEFEFTLTFANAPIDSYARGNRSAMSKQQKEGAVVFFQKASCVQCHAVSGSANEMFSDFKNHVAGIPQIAPKFGQGFGNVPFRNAQGQLAPEGNQDFGLFDITESKADMYKFRTSPLRNIATQAAFFHNGAFTRLEDALRYHIDTLNAGRTYDPAKAGVAADLRGNTGPSRPVLERLDPALRNPVKLSESDIQALLAFLRDGLLDPEARPENLRKLIPTAVPSGLPLPRFESGKAH